MKTAIITGAARGIGLSVAQRFLHEGYHVVMLDNNAETLDQAVRQLNQSNRILQIVCDVSDQEQVVQSIENVVTLLERIDVLVNNAGIADFQPVAKTSSALWSDILNTNLSGPFFVSQACIPQMLLQGSGSIINVTSISGLRASTLRAAYGTSKAALAHLTKQLAAELGQHGIRVNAVAPGPIDTEMAKKVHSDEIRADYHAAIPLNRYGREEEVANAIYFLGCEQSSYITGQEICVDGGFDSTGIGLPTLRASPG
ncbi:3-oxoacyl-ACP reductase [Chromatiales bacterium (ex Bugula neritina AB1)]|nr:3-oxoacyl-ACP reductase [Chromatiales bacterium (ex Bugula neritina AB1)]